MKTESTFADALAKHRQLMQYFGAKLTPDDLLRGALLEALHSLETGQADEAKATLAKAIEDHGLNGELAVSAAKALNWIDLSMPDMGAVHLRSTLIHKLKTP